MNIKYVVFITLGFVIIVGFMKLNSSRKIKAQATQASSQRTDTEDQKVYSIPEKPAVPLGGLQALYQHIQKNLKYPDLARIRGIEGRVFVEFIVEKNGTVDHLKIIKGIDKACDKEAIRLIKSFAKWNPGLHQGKIVRVKRSFPVLFEL